LLLNILPGTGHPPIGKKYLVQNVSSEAVERPSNSDLITPPFVSHGKDGHGFAMDLLVFYPPITAPEGGI